MLLRDNRLTVDEIIPSLCIACKYQDTELLEVGNFSSLYLQRCRSNKKRDRFELK